MPLRNRLEEVINRYEKASNLVKNYKEGAISEDDLGKGFKRLRKERKAVDQNNRTYIQEQRRLYLGHNIEEEDEDESVEASEEAEDDEDTYEDEEYEEEEEGSEKLPPTSSAHGDEKEVTAKPSRKEEKLWRQYGSFWDSV